MNKCLSSQIDENTLTRLIRGILANDYKELQELVNQLSEAKISVEELQEFIVATRLEFGNAQNNVSQSVVLANAALAQTNSMVGLIYKYLGIGDEVLRQFLKVFEKIQANGLYKVSDVMFPPQDDPLYALVPKLIDPFTDINSTEINTVLDILQNRDNYLRGVTQNLADAMQTVNAKFTNYIPTANIVTDTNGMSNRPTHVISEKVYSEVSAALATTLDNMNQSIVNDRKVVTDHIAEAKPLHDATTLGPDTIKYDRGLTVDVENSGSAWGTVGQSKRGFQAIAHVNNINTSQAYSVNRFSVLHIPSDEQLLRTQWGGYTGVQAESGYGWYFVEDKVSSFRYVFKSTGELVSGILRTNNVILQNGGIITERPGGIYVRNTMPAADGVLALKSEIPPAVMTKSGMLIALGTDGLTGFDGFMSAMANVPEGSITGKVSFSDTSQCSIEYWQV